MIWARREDSTVRRFLGIITFSILLLMMPHLGEANTKTIQERIDEAEEGEAILIPSGTYEEALFIDKQVTISGEGEVLFKVKHNKPAITIAADDVSLENLSIQYDSDEADQAAIYISGNHNHLESIDIKTSKKAVLLDEAHYNVLSKLTVQGDASLAIKERQRGIDLWKANYNTINHTQISDTEDAIYVESGSDNVLHDNSAANSRYGYHLMFTKNSELYANESYENISGMMIMGTNGTKVYENNLFDNQKNVQSLGLLLFDVRHALIENNEIRRNRIGIFVENAADNEIRNNDVANNFVGLQFKQAEDNLIHHNAFTANVVQGQAEASMDNLTNHNFWSNHTGLDITGDGFSDLTYKVDPFYLHVTNKYPAFRLLFQAPGFNFLEKMMHTPIEQQLVDDAPLMENPLLPTDEPADKSKTILLISSLLFVFSLSIIYMGVKQS